MTKFELSVCLHCCSQVFKYPAELNIFSIELDCQTPKLGLNIQGIMNLKEQHYKATLQYLTSMVTERLEHPLYSSLDSPLIVFEQAKYPSLILYLLLLNSLSLSTLDFNNYPPVSLSHLEFCQYTICQQSCVLLQNYQLHLPYLQ